MEYYIRRVRVSGLFEQLEELSVDFNQAINCIYGANGTGKTALINLIVNALRVNVHELLRIPFESITILIAADGKKQPENFLTVTRHWENLEYTFYKDHQVNPMPIQSSRRSVVISANRPLTPIQSKNIADIQQNLLDENQDVTSIPIFLLRRLINSHLALTYVPLLRHNHAHDIRPSRFDMRWANHSEKDEIDRNDPNVQVLEELQEEISRKYASVKSEIARKLESLSSIVFEKLLLEEGISKVENEATDFIHKLLVSNKMEYDELKVDSVINKVSDLNLNIPEYKIRNHYASWYELQKRLLESNNALSTSKEKNRDKLTIDYSKAYFNLLASARVFAKFESAIEEIEKVHYIKQVLLSPFDLFTEIINGFLGEYKAFAFNDSGEFIFTNHSRTLDISNLSSGEKHLVAILGRVCFSTHEGASIFIADEPELSLHLEWQRKILPAIKKLSANTQVIVATHAPAIISRNSNKINIQQCYKHA